MSIDLEEIEQKYESEWFRFKELPNKRAKCQETHAFLLLESLIPNLRGGSMICSAEHDQIWLDVLIEDVEKNFNEDQYKELLYCGVFYDSELGCLSMFR